LKKITENILDADVIHFINEVIDRKYQDKYNVDSYFDLILISTEMCKVGVSNSVIKQSMFILIELYDIAKLDFWKS
jgi:hypothetical protein